MGLLGGIWLADQLADEGLSFVHLQEILRLSGLLAIQGGRSARSEEDLNGAVKIVAGNHHEAVRGFPAKPAAPFGLAALRVGKG